MLKEVPLNKFYRLINDGPCVLITSHARGKSNIAPVAWTTPVNDEPPLVGLPLADTHFTTELIQESNEFVINIPSEKLLPAIIHTGRSSGRNENKFASAGLRPADSVKIATPRIDECVGYLECKVRQNYPLNGVILFIAEVVLAQVREELFDEYWHSEKAKIVHHLGGGYFAVLGKRFKG